MKPRVGYGATVQGRAQRSPLFGLALLVAVASASVAPPAGAQVPLAQPAPDPAATGEAGARPHFERALELYRAGKYTLALEQLSRAAELDPHGKDLFFNQALVHEKLGQLPQAIRALERYRELETEPAERERARLTVERLQGALEAGQLPAAAPSATCPELPAPPAAPKSPHVALIGAASVSVVALVVGAVFGAKALGGDVSDARTGPTLSREQLRERGSRAERDALVADVAFAVSGAAAGTFACVWLLAPGEPSQRAAGLTLRSYF